MVFKILMKIINFLLDIADFVLDKLDYFFIAIIIIVVGYFAYKFWRKVKDEI